MALVVPGTGVSGAVVLVVNGVDVVVSVEERVDVDSTVVVSDASMGSSGGGTVGCRSDEPPPVDGAGADGRGGSVGFQ